MRVFISWLTAHSLINYFTLNARVNGVRISSLCEFEMAEPFENRAIFFNEFAANIKACFGGDQTWSRDRAAILYDESNRGPFKKYCGGEGDNQLGIDVARLPSFLHSSHSHSGL